MKGIVFTEFLEMVEVTFSMELANKLIDETELASGGIYTSVGTYDVAEMIALVTTLSQETQTPANDLVRAFGHYLFNRFHIKFPHFFEAPDDTFSFLLRVEDYIHIEVRKLYPDAALPSFDCSVSEDNNQMEMLYRSPRCLGDLAHGLIQGCIDHYNEPLTITRDTLDERGSRVRFTITRERG